MAFDPLALPAGTLRHSITIQSPSSTPDQFGQTTTSWTTALSTRASIDVLTQKEQYQANALTSQVSHVIKIRYPGSITISPGMRVQFGSHTYVIQSCDNVQERNRVLKLFVLALNDSE